MLDVERLKNPDLYPAIIFLLMTNPSIYYLATMTNEIDNFYTASTMILQNPIPVNTIHKRIMPKSGYLFGALMVPAQAGDIRTIRELLGHKVVKTAWFTQ